MCRESWVAEFRGVLKGGIHEFRWVVASRSSGVDKFRVGLAQVVNSKAWREKFKWSAIREVGHGVRVMSSSTKARLHRE